jgi:hypothetical protein
MSFEPSLDQIVTVHLYSGHVLPRVVVNESMKAGFAALWRTNDQGEIEHIHIREADIVAMIFHDYEGARAFAILETRPAGGHYTEVEYR